MTNIALVVLDTLRKDAFDRHFDWLPGRRYDRAFATANWTVPSHASLFTGRYASELGVHAKQSYFTCDERALAERLAEQGYTTRAYSANTNITAHFDFDRGFDDFRTPERFDHMSDDRLFDWREFSRGTTVTGIPKILLGIRECIKSDCDTVRSLLFGAQLKLDRLSGPEYGGAAEALEMVRELKFGDREFLFLNLMEAHEPYRAPPKYMTGPEPELTNSVGDLTFGESIDADRTRRAYEDCVRYLSDTYRDLFDVLIEQFEYVVTLSDHGELLGEHDAWGHEHGVYPELTHVPLCISGPDSTLQGRTDTPVSLLDVYATVLELSGIEPTHTEGTGLIDGVDAREHLTEYLGLTAWSGRRLKESEYGENYEAYEEPLRGIVSPTGEYGYETIDGFSGTGRERLRERLERLEVRDVERNNEVPDEVKSRLSDLGYA